MTGFYKYVTFGAYNYVVNGYSDGSFKPHQNVTRAEAVKIILMATGLDLPFETSNSVFSDVSNDAWYKYFVMAAYESDLLGGYGDGTFRPDQPVTRAEASAIINAVMKTVIMQ